MKALSYKEECEFDQKLLSTINAPFFKQQWYLENNGQRGGKVGADVKARDAWSITKGDPNITIAIIDLGFDIFHEALNITNKIVHPINLTIDPPDHSLARSYYLHGTACAGIATASQNNLGISGIAPDCQLMPIKVSSDIIANQNILSEAMYYAVDHQADIISCSLGPNNSPWPMQPVLREAIDYATTKGRNGRGCIIFWSTGNRKYKDLPISINEVASYKNIIAVGASTNLDRIAHYSPQGPEMDIVAPSNGGTQAIFTTVDTGLGSNQWTPHRNYIDNFGGTSAATPLAAGIGALILSVNRDLNWQSVRQIIFDSADKIGDVVYQPSHPNRPAGTHNNVYGYGRVNAAKAVLLAQNS